ncbi:MAG TPA: oligosaccharide flippase family protein [Coleofasciculaceae cyanobacterium]|jgi:O-antigen/teichoic acid export membrane protein
MQSKQLTLRRNFSWTFVGNAVYAACQWGMLVVLAKLGSPEMVGQFTLGLAITAPVFMFTNLQLRHIQATDAKQQYLFGDYLSLRLISTALGLALIAMITLAAGYRWEISLVILLVGLAKAFESISDVFYGLIQQQERMDRIALSLMLKGPISLIMLGLGVYLSGNIIWGMIGLVVSWAIVAIGYDLRNGKSILKNIRRDTHNKELILDARLKLNWERKKLANLIWLALPLGFGMLLISLNVNIPRYFVERYLGERELGFFAAIAYLMVAGNMVVNALGESATPKLAKYYAAGDSKAFRKLLIWLLGIAASLGGLAIIVAKVAGSQILTLVYQPEYAKYVDLFVWLMVAAGISYISSFLGYAMTAARYFRVQMPLFSIATATSALSCFWLVPTFELKGAAIALILSAVVQAIMTFGVIIHALNTINKHA